jgi:hypothetical protein
MALLSFALYPAGLVGLVLLIQVLFDRLDKTSRK